MFLKMTEAWPDTRQIRNKLPMKLLLHTCCAPCSIQCVEALTAEEKIPDLFWYNPNIHPYTEYRSRLESLCLFAKDRKLNLLTENEYGLRSFIRAVSSIENAENENGDVNAENHTGKKRCGYCYRVRLEKTARMAAERSYDAFSTTLLISPYQDHELLKKTGEDMANKFALEFLYRDFRPLFREGQRRAREALL